MGIDANEAEREAAKVAKQRARSAFDSISETTTSSHFDKEDGIYKIRGQVIGTVQEGKIIKRRTPVVREFEAPIDAKNRKLRGFEWLE